ncbi:peptidoglycan DD-metalloendopeptidase family protein [Marinobacter sp. F3R08]|uniref:peptidoglycan DD-metalloendopeptidase family protein n=1 Tax=Marinobacter sp. F3R08 TaxID=2841559 RepID=UPI001C099210|nr:peptidoglycan DD-metalloendopeptidase family protein [Marinobacter sp. F3R08]MBU2953378.1 peptidoglycan DD-metalloendopeptidase family protein [Marinobacter sp. F3R08]
MSAIRTFSPLHKVSLAVSGLIILAICLASFPTSSALTETPAPAQAIPLAADADEAQDSNISATDKVPVPDHSETRILTRRVQPGDTLIGIFNDSKAPLADLRNIMEADADYLSLDPLVPGTELALTFDTENRFSALTLQLDPARKVIFSRQEDGSFIYEKREQDTSWVSEVLRGTIQGSLYASALRSGLTRAQVLLVDQLLGGRVNFRKDLRAGDEFAVIIGHEMAGKQSTGSTRIEAIALTRGPKTHYAFRFDDGNYYDTNGESVTPAFLRWPTRKHFRVSSRFNHNRIHPITGRPAPHNGVDLATPVGTPVLSTGDGVIRHIGNHPYAGKYIDIDHGGTHTTRYLHLNKILVKKGAQVQRGQQIALSGNTGRSTGPHLHFEFHINGRPVDPMTADIPTATAIPEADIARFNRKLEDQLAVMEYATSRSDLVVAKAPSLFD